MSDRLCDVDDGPINTTHSSYLHDKEGRIAEIMFALGVFGNVLALIVLFTSPPKQRKTLFYRLVVGLTITDLIGTTLTSPVVIAVHANSFHWIGGKYTCFYFGFIMIWAGYATMLIIAAMSVERLISMRYPYLHRTRLSTKHATIILISCLVLASAIASLPLFGFGRIILKYPCTWCFFDYYSHFPADKAFNYFYAIFAIVIIFVTLCCNFTSMCTLSNKCCCSSVIHKEEHFRKFCKSKKYRDCEMLVQLMGITLVFSVCYLPLMVKVLINQNGHSEDLHSDFIVIRMASTNQILDPWVYILLRRELLWKIISSVKQCFGREDKLDNLPVRQMYEDGDQTFCTFCNQCLCLPPMNWESNSMNSLTGRRMSTVPSSTPPDLRRMLLRRFPESVNNKHSINVPIQNNGQDQNKLAK